METREITPKKMQGYQIYLEQEERGSATIQKYLHDVKELALWLSGEPITRERLAEWKRGLQNGGKKPATVNSKLAAVNSFLKFAGWEDCRVKFLRLQRRLFREEEKNLTRADYEKLLQAAEENGKARLALLLQTICGTGVRVSEVQAITVEAARRGQAEIALKGKIRTILLPGKLCRKLLKYAQKQKIASGAIFRTRSGKSLSRKQIWAEMKSLCEGAGVDPGKVFPHNLRHLFATVFYRACRDIVKLADVLGHSSIETTRIYLVETGAEHARQLERLQLVR